MTEKVEISGRLPKQSQVLDTDEPPTPQPATPGRRWFWWLPVLGWMAVIYILSAQPDFTFAPDAWKIEPVSLVVHSAEYAILACLVWIAAWKTKILSNRALWIALGLAVLYAFTDELHQVFVPGRVADVRDVAADVLGAIVVLLVIYIWRRRQS